MSGSESHHRSCAVRRGAALTLLFASVLATAAATDSLPRAEEETSRVPTRNVAATADRDEVARAAAEAMADGKSATEAAEEVVSRSGDRWGAVYDKSQYEEFEQALDGEYTGVGLGARRTGEGLIEVTRVQQGGPAARAGITPGDTIRTIDGAAVARRPVTEVMALLRGSGSGSGPDSGAEGTTVVLGLERDGRTWTRSLRRARLATESVTVERIGTTDGTGGTGGSGGGLSGDETAAGTADGSGAETGDGSGADADALRITVEAFTKGSGQRVRDAVLGAPEGVGILLDLRGNAGGLVTEAVTAASAFLDGGLVATYDIRGEQRALYATPGGDTARPVVVLVDGGTMSAAELVTGALKDRGRSVTVGSRTFGKGSVQMPSRLPDGSVAELTVGHYRTPAGHGVDGRGVTPDLLVSEDAQERATTVLSGLGGGAAGGGSGGERSGGSGGTR
ncbi:PDZ domain-containing protein [Streptomyces sp. GMY02]|uniref:S41 family peptidase n=1 Tax=Streptomyces sp. GMY02 TaxID=1333528 RepID=UPI001C2BEDD0|nr:S41 family peptidase [Streptomyces sp. GMY02]QXE36607.1 PDZ domain-containing protein [Streptomyces sp. GMY02]